MRFVVCVHLRTSRTNTTLLQQVWCQVTIFPRDHTDPGLIRFMPNMWVQPLCRWQLQLYISGWIFQGMWKRLSAQRVSSEPCGLQPLMINSVPLEIQYYTGSQLSLITSSALNLLPENSYSLGNSTPINLTRIEQLEPKLRNLVFNLMRFRTRFPIPNQPADNVPLASVHEIERRKIFWGNYLIYFKENWKERELFCF